MKLPSVPARNVKILRKLILTAVPAALLAGALLFSRTTQRISTEVTTTGQHPVSVHASLAAPNSDRMGLAAAAVPTQSATETLSLDSVPTSVRAIPNIGGHADFSSRFKAIRALGTSLGDNEILALYKFLRSRGPENQPARKQENALKNDVMDTLLAQEEPPPGLTDLFIQLYQDKSQDVVIRDYAVQHLGAWYERAPKTDKPVIRQVFNAAQDESDSSIAGTALLALYDLSVSNPDIDRSQIAAAALYLANDRFCGELTRITALQVCARFGTAEVVPVALHLAETADSIPLRISALAVLGDTGDQAVRAVLERFANEENPRLQLAAQSALQRLNKRAGI